MSTPDNKDALRPIDPITRKPIGPFSQPGYYPGFNTLAQQNFWDDATRTVVIARVNDVPPIRFFTSDQHVILEAICARILPQDDRHEAHRIPIVPRIDARLHEGRHDGYRFEGMPPDGEAFQLGIQAIDEMAHRLYNRGFAEIPISDQERLLESLHDGKPAVANPIWDRMPVGRFWSLLTQDCAEAYYAHPFAWDEIGFGGPAYPRGYMRLENGEPEPWEVRERRYSWEPPIATRSGNARPQEGDDHYGSPGQGGTH
jgi:hypothetical protein